MQGLPDQLEEADYVTVPRSEWRALLEEVATVRRLVAELAARLPAVDDAGDDPGDAPPKETGGRVAAPPADAGRPASVPNSDAETRPADAPPPAGAPQRPRVALRPTVVRRDELGRSIRAYEMPLQSVRPPGRRTPGGRRDGTPVAGARTPSLDALRARVEQAAAQAADAKRPSRLSRWTARFGGRQPDSGSGS